MILDTARRIAETDGWDAVTTRRLAESIEYSQPVLYSHFAGKTDIVAAVALEGFTELAARLRECAGSSVGGRAAETLTAVAEAYLDFAREHPAVYNAMFALDTGLRFAAEDSPEPLRAAFGALRDTVAGATGPVQVDTRTELLWSTLHGLASLTAGHRLRPEQAEERMALLIAQALAAAG
jgi:AcrR family transcriptional regulator